MLTCWASGEFMSLFSLRKRLPAEQQQGQRRAGSHSHPTQREAPGMCLPRRGARPSVAWHQPNTSRPGTGATYTSRMHRPDSPQTAVAAGPLLPHRMPIPNPTNTACLLEAWHPPRL
jgi:hypothetical protein